MGKLCSLRGKLRTNHHIKIVVYCTKPSSQFQLNDANDIVNEEIHRLDHNADAAFETVNARFQTVLDNVERRRQEVIIRAIFLNIA